DRSRTIDKGIAFAHEIGRRRAQTDAHLVSAGLRAGVADGVAGLDGALFRDRTGARQDRFKECGFSALKWSHQRDAPGTAGTSDVLSHLPSPYLEHGPSKAFSGEVVAAVAAEKCSNSNWSAVHLLDRVPLSRKALLRVGIRIVSVSRRF